MQVQQFLEEMANLRIPRKKLYIESVIGAFKEFESLNSEDQRFIPEKFRTKPFEYFILYYFDLFYLSETRMLIAGANLLAEDTEMQQIKFKYQTETIGSIDLSQDSIDRYESEYKELESVFLEIGLSLIEGFKLSDLQN